MINEIIFVRSQEQTLMASTYIVNWHFSSVRRLCILLIHYVFADSRFKSLQLGPLFCHKVVEERITVAAFC
jgi:hypothetical protein